MKTITKLTLAILCLTLCVFLAVSCGKNVTEDEDVKPDDEVSILSAPDQEAVDGYLTADIAIPADKADSYDSFALRVYYGDNLISETVLAADAKEVNALTTYGRLDLKLVGINGDSEEEIASQKVAVYADEYNFASLNGTFPVVYFTLDMYSMGEDAQPAAFTESTKGLPIMKDVPTFVSLERVKAYSWEDLPENVYPLPMLSEEEVNTIDFHGNNEKMAAYIKELYEINPASFFNFYCVDNYAELVLRFFTAQNIPDDSFRATLISDGTATAVNFQLAFEGEDASEVFKKMSAEWSRIKAAAKNGDEDFLENVYLGNEDYSILSKYPMVMAAVEDNIQLWVSRDLFTNLTPSQDVKNVIATLKFTGDLKIFGINDMLSILDEKQQAHLKTLFHFDGQMFDGTPEGKETLVIIGSSPAGESSERGDLEAFLKVLDLEYTDKYTLYYKGHPGYPVELDPTKGELFEKTGLINLEASIAAELIMFYCPDITLAGWGSTTFKSVQEGKFLVLFNYSKAAGIEYATAQGYPELPEAFYHVEEIGGKNYVIVEYRDNDTVKYFDMTAGAFVSAPNA